MVRSAPISSRVANRPVRSGLSPTPWTVTASPGRSAPRPAGRRRRTGRPARHVGAPRQRLAAGEADQPAAGVGARRRPSRRNGAACSRCGRGWLRARSPGHAGGVQAGQQHRRFHLGGGHRAGVVQRQQAARPSGERQASAGAGAKRAPIGGQRVQHPAHRPAAQAGVAGEDGEQRKPAAAPMISRAPVPALPSRGRPPAR